jgi:sugar phosphate isomerase/epimerase
MRLAFSTLGIPSLPVPEAVRLAAEAGFEGLELRAHPEEPVHTGLTAAERNAVAGEFRATGVEVLTVAGYAKVASPGDDEAVLAEGRELLALAGDLGASFVRVFPGGPTGPDADPATADATAARRLAALAPLAADHGVRLLLETHDSHRSGEAAARVLAAVGHGSVGALWDVLHTWLSGEQPGASHRLLAPFLGYTQVKDVASAEDLTPLPPGEGVLPLAEAVRLLTHAGGSADPVVAPREEWLCWEYEKRWFPQVRELPELLPAVGEHLRALVAAG